MLLWFLSGLKGNAGGGGGGGWFLTGVAGGEDRGGGVEAQHPTDHFPVDGVKVVVTHGAPDPVVLDLHATSGFSRNQAHFDCREG